MRAGGHKKRAAAVCVCAVLFLSAVAFVVHKRAGGGAASARMFTVRAETYRNRVEIAGVISAAKEQNLQAAGSGTITAVFVKEGDTVVKNQVILRLDDTEQRYNLARHDYDSLQRALSSPRREIELMTRRHEALLQRIKDRQIIAGFNGVIAQFSAPAGDVVEAKDITGIIIDRSYLKATVEIVETDAPGLKTGRNVILRFPAAGNTPVPGRVHSFPAVATKTARGVSVVKTEIRVENPPEIILPNYSFTGEIEPGPPDPLLLVEEEAVEYENAGGAAENTKTPPSTTRRRQSAVLTRLCPQLGIPKCSI